MSATDTPITLPVEYSQREIAYNAYLCSLDSRGLEVYLDALWEDESLELHFHDLYVAGIIIEHDIGCMILHLLGEL